MGRRLSEERLLRLRERCSPLENLTPKGGSKNEDLSDMEVFLLPPLYEMYRFIKLSWSLERPTQVGFWFELSEERNFCYELEITRKSSTQRQDFASLASLNRQSFELLFKRSRLTRLISPFSTIGLFTLPRGSNCICIPEIGWIGISRLEVDDRFPDRFLSNSKSHGNNFFPYAIGKKGHKSLYETSIPVERDSVLSHMHMHMCKHFVSVTMDFNNTESWHAREELKDSFGHLYKKKWIREAHGLLGQEVVNPRVDLEFRAADGFFLSTDAEVFPRLRTKSCVNGSDGRCRRHLGSKEDPDQIQYIFPSGKPVNVPQQVVFRHYDEDTANLFMSPGFTITSDFIDSYAKLLTFRSNIYLDYVDNDGIEELQTFFVGRSFPQVRILTISTKDSSLLEEGDLESLDDRSYERAFTYYETVSSTSLGLDDLDELDGGYGLSRESLVALKAMFPRLDCLHIDYAHLHNAASVPVVDIFGDAWHPTVPEESDESEDDDEFQEDWFEQLHHLPEAPDSEEEGSEDELSD